MPASGGSSRHPAGEPASAEAEEPVPAAVRRLVRTVAVLVGLAVAAHLGISALHVAPGNAVSRDYSSGIEAYMNPEFEQGWSLFAPNPPTSDTRIYARARLAGSGGALTTTPWIDIGAAELSALRHHPLPTRTRLMLRKAFYLLVKSDGRQGQELVKRLALRHLPRELDLSAVRQVQLRSTSVPVPAPRWEPQTPRTELPGQEFGWWPAGPADIPAGGAK